MINKKQALKLNHGRVIYHKKLRNADGSAVRARVNGMCKTWKTRPTEFQIPMVHGLKDYFYLSHHNAGEWSLADPTTEFAKNGG